MDFAMSADSSSNIASPAAHGLLGEARVRLLDHLCGSPQTATELGSKLGISANATRVHLDGLQRAGLVEYRVERRGVGKPTHVYSTTASAEYLLSAAYAPTLNAVLKAVASRLNGELAPVLRDAGSALFDEASQSADASPPSPLKAAVRALEMLGRPVKVTKRGTARMLSTQCCPLGAVSRRSENACVIVESMLANASGLPVYQACDRGDLPRCRFVVDEDSKRRRQDIPDVEALEDGFDLGVALD
jgi:predicted ArsR family transcriptional regulator